MTSLRSTLDDLLKTSIAPSLGAAVILGGELHNVEVVGLRKRGENVQVQRTDKYHLGLCGQAMTAVLAARLVDQDRLSWDTTIVDVFGDRPIHPGYAKVTLKQLLNHQARCPASVNEERWQGLGHRSASEQRLALVTEVLAKPPLHLAAFSDVNYLVVGAMLEKITRESFEALLQEELFIPLGLTSAGFGAPAKTEAISQPFGHNPDPVEPLIHGDDPKALTPVGTIHCSLKDWATFASLYLADEPRLFISEASLSYLRGDAPGWVMNNSHPNFGRILWLGAGNTMFHAAISLYLDMKTAIMVTTNIGGQIGEEICLTASLQIEQGYLGKR